MHRSKAEPGRSAPASGSARSNPAPASSFPPSSDSPPTIPSSETAEIPPPAAAGHPAETPAPPVSCRSLKVKRTLLARGIKRQRQFATPSPPPAPKPQTPARSTTTISTPGDVTAAVALAKPSRSQRGPAHTAALRGRNHRTPVAAGQHHAGARPGNRHHSDPGPAARPSLSRTQTRTSCASAHKRARQTHPSNNTAINPTTRIPPMMPKTRCPREPPARL